MGLMGAFCSMPIGTVGVPVADTRRPARRYPSPGPALECDPAITDAGS
jgi:hypothetical protein